MGSGSGTDKRETGTHIRGMGSGSETVDLEQTYRYPQEAPTRGLHEIPSWDWAFTRLETSLISLTPKMIVHTRFSHGLQRTCTLLRPNWDSTHIHTSGATVVCFSNRSHLLGYSAVFKWNGFRTMHCSKLTLHCEDACLEATNGGDRIQSQEDCNGHKSLTRNDCHLETAG